MTEPQYVLPNNIIISLVPGNVTSVMLESDEEVTKPRMLRISWKAPNEIDLNGILTAYYVTWENLDVSVIFCKFRITVSIYVHMYL